MPSIIIGGENTNVGLRYMDELARQRELALREAAFRQSQSQSSSSSSSSRGMNAGVGGARMVQAPETQQAQALQMGENGLPIDAEQRAQFMRQMFASQQNNAKAQQMQQLDQNAKQYDSHLSQFSQAMKQAQTPEQVEEFSRAIQDVTTKKQKAIDQLRGLMSTPNKTGNPQLDALAAALGRQAGGKNITGDVSPEPYEAMGKFYAHGAQQKVADKQEAAKLMAEDKRTKFEADEKARTIKIAQYNLDDAREAVDRVVKSRNSGGMSREAMQSGSSNLELLQNLKQAQEAFDAVAGTKTGDMITPASDALTQANIAGFDKAQERQDAMDLKKSNTIHDNQIADAKLRHLEATAQMEWTDNRMDKVSKLDPEAVAGYIEREVQDRKALFGKDTDTATIQAIKRSHPSLNEEALLDIGAASRGDKRGALTYYLEQQARNETKIPSIQANGKPNYDPLTMQPITETRLDSRARKAGKNGFRANYIRSVLESRIRALKAELGVK